MIRQDAKLSIQRIPLECLQVKDYDQRYLDMVAVYVENLRRYPHEDAGMIRVVPSTTHPGMFVIEDGHHKFCASIIAGRKDALCVVIEKPSEEWVAKGVQRLMTCLSHADDEQCAACGEDA